MSLTELAVRVMAYAQPLIPYMLVVALATAGVLPVLLLLGRGVWVDRGRFRWMGLFLGLGRWDCLRLGCAWIKLLVLLSFLVSFQKLGMAQYLLFLVPGLVQCLSGRELPRIPGRLVWLGLELVALLSCNMVCGYIRDVNAGTLYYVIYIFMALFAALFGVYLFLTELNDISAGRSTDLEYEWDREHDAEDGEE